MTAVLGPGVTVKGQIVGPDGEPVVDVWMISRIHLSSLGRAREWRGDRHGTARSGRFELHGLDRDSEVPVSFFELVVKCLDHSVHVLYFAFRSSTNSLAVLAPALALAFRERACFEVPVPCFCREAIDFIG